MAELPLSFAQERLWFVDQLEPGSAAYNLPGALWLRGALAAPVFAAAVAEVVRRHEALRTVFAMSAYLLGGPARRCRSCCRRALPRCPSST